MSGAVIRELEADGKTYQLTFKFATMRQAEGAMGGKSVLEVLARGMSLDDISAIVWAALQPQHAISREAADDLLDVAGMPAVSVILSDALKAFFGTRGGSKEGSVGNAPATAKKAPSRRS